jgi:glutamyl-Q tRNA(Asp) synthetase
LFGWTPPSICHIPLITNHSGDKISKQNHAKPIQDNNLSTLLRALHYLKIDLVSPLSIAEALSLAIEAWDPNKLKGMKHLSLEEQDLHFI